MFFFPREEVELGQMTDGLPLYASLKGEVEVVQGFYLGKPGRPHPVFSPVLFPGRYLLR